MELSVFYLVPKYFRSPKTLYSIVHDPAPIFAITKYAKKVPFKIRHCGSNRNVTFLKRLQSIVNYTWFCPKYTRLFSGYPVMCLVYLWTLNVVVQKSTTALVWQFIWWWKAIVGRAAHLDDGMCVHMWRKVDPEKSTHFYNAPNGLVDLRGSKRVQSTMPCHHGHMCVPNFDAL